MSEETLRYKKALKSFPFIVEDDDGKETQYTCRELNGKLRGEWLAFEAKCVQFGPGGTPVGASKMDQLQTKLLHLSCFDEAGKHVEASVIEGWGSEQIQDLYERARVLSVLDRKKKDGEGPEGNA